MFKNLIPVLAQIDTRLLLVLGGLAVIICIISIIKRAVKAGILLLLVALILGGSVPVVNNIKENYGMSYDKRNEVLTVKVAGNQIILPFKDIKDAKSYSIRMEEGSTTTKLHLFYQCKDGSAVSEQGSQAIEIPNFMMGVLKKYLDGQGLQYTTDRSGLTVP